MPLKSTPVASTDMWSGLIVVEDLCKYKIPRKYCESLTVWILLHEIATIYAFDHEKGKVDTILFCDIMSRFPNPEYWDKMQRRYGFWFQWDVPSVEVDNLKEMQFQKGLKDRKAGYEQNGDLLDSYRTLWEAGIMNDEQYTEHAAKGVEWFKKYNGKVFKGNAKTSGRTAAMGLMTKLAVEAKGRDLAVSPIMAIRPNYWPDVGTYYGAWTFGFELAIGGKLSRIEEMDVGPTRESFHIRTKDGLYIAMDAPGIERLLGIETEDEGEDEDDGA